MKVKELIHSSFRESGVPGLVEGILTAFIYFLLLISVLPVGFKFSMVNFTYGARGLDPVQKHWLPWLLPAHLAGMYIWELFSRGFLLRLLLKHFSWQKAFWLHLAVINAVIVPLFFTKALGWSSFGIFRFFLGENFYEALLALCFLRSGSLIATALLHGAWNFIRFTIINDISGPFETFYFYSPASDHFYSLILAVLFFAAAIQLTVIRQWGIRKAGGPID